MQHQIQKKIFAFSVLHSLFSVIKRAHVCKTWKCVSYVNVMKSRQQHIDYMLFYLDSVHFLSLGHWVCRTSSQLLQSFDAIFLWSNARMNKELTITINLQSGFSLLCLYYLIIHQPKKNKPFSKSLNEICIRNICSENDATQDHTNYTRNVLPSITKQYWYHESGLWTSITRHQWSPAHHMDSCTTLLLHFPPGLQFPSSIALMTHTQCKHWLQLIHSWSYHTHTPYLSHELPHSDRRVL